MQEIPQPVSELLVTLENDEQRQIAKAKVALNKDIAQILEDFGREIPESGGLMATPKVQIQNGGLLYDFWIEEKYKVREGDQKVKQTILYVMPEDDTEGYGMATIEDETILDIGENKIDEVEEITSLSKVFEFLRERLEKTKVPA